MKDHHINTVFVKYVQISQKTSGKELYKILEVDMDEEVVLLIKPHDHFLKGKYLVLPDDRLIVLPTTTTSSNIPEYLIFSIKKELFFQMFDLKTTYPH